MPYSTLSDPQWSKTPDIHFDFIVIGAGSAGCPLASRLSEDRSVTVLLIEAGPQDHGVAHSLNGAIPSAVARLQHTSMDWQYYAQPQNPRACTYLNTFRGAIESRKYRSFWPRGKGIGGSSLINYLAWVRGHPYDYDDWESNYGCTGWSWAALQHVHERIENTSECIPELLCSKCHRQSLRGPYGISHRKPVNSLVRRFLEACQELGHDVGDYNCPHHQATKGMAGVHQQSVRSGTRCSAARAYIEPLLVNQQNRPNLTVLSGARCVKLLTQIIDDELTATGVQVVPDDETSVKSSVTFHLLSNKEVVLSAGALGSPQILLQSGIGPNGTTYKSSHVGRNLSDHLVTYLWFQPALGQGKQDIGCINGYKSEGSLWKLLYNLWDCFMNHQGILASTTYDASLFYSSKPISSSTDLIKVRPNLQISLLCSPVNDLVLHDNIGLDFDAYDLPPEEIASNAEAILLCCTLLHTQSQGYLTVNDQNELVIHPNYLSDPEDVKQLMVCMRKGIEIANTKALQPLIKGTPFWPKDLCNKYDIPCHDEECVATVGNYPDEFLEEVIRRYATTLYHPTSTCRMGKSADDAVVDHTLKFFGINNLRIADASIQPTIVSANTQASCVLIGEKAADIIREEYNLKTDQKDLLDAIERYEASILRKRKLIVGGLFVAATALVAGVAAVFVVGVKLSGQTK